MEKIYWQQNCSPPNAMQAMFKLIVVFGRRQTVLIKNITLILELEGTKGDATSKLQFFPYDLFPWIVDVQMQCGWVSFMHYRGFTYFNIDKLYHQYKKTNYKDIRIFVLWSGPFENSFFFSFWNYKT